MGKRYRKDKWPEDVFCKQYAARLRWEEMFCRCYEDLAEKRTKQLEEGTHFVIKDDPPKHKEDYPRI
jgi:hypothetical protein